MERLKTLIEENLPDFPEFSYYLPIIEKALNYHASRPDTAIECCNSLLQGFSKTVVLNLDPKATAADLDSRAEAGTDKLIKRALRCLKANDDVYEDDFASRGASLALAIATLRNARGDISHGKAVPKLLESHTNLANVANEMSGSLLRYILSSYFIIMSNKRLAVQLPTTEEPEPFTYDDNPDFNDYLDELYPLEGKLLYSEALFNLYQEDYEIQLSEFRASQDEAESNE